MSKKSSIQNLGKPNAVRRSKWKRDSGFRLLNKKWLDYSAKIALRIDAILEDRDNFNQADFAKSLGVTPQQISKILQGRENLTLKTIGKLSDALGFELISFPPYKDSFVYLMDQHYRSVTVAEPVLKDSGLINQNSKAHKIIVREGATQIKNTSILYAA